MNKLSRRWTVTRSVGVVNVVHIEGGFGLRLDSGFALSELVLSVAEVVEGLPRMTVRRRFSTSSKGFKRVRLPEFFPSFCRQYFLKMKNVW